MARNHQTDSLLDFIQTSPTPYHAVQNLQKKIEQLNNGEKLTEDGNWELHNHQSYYLNRRGSSFAGFKIPSQLSMDLSFSIIVAHTDSPCLKLKPQRKPSVENYYQWGTEVYGGALYNSWLDRDLLIAGRVSYMDGNKAVSKEVNLTDFKCRIPQLAIHLDREVNQGLRLNPQNHLVPILGLESGQSSKDLWALLRRHAQIPAQIKNEWVSFDLFLHDATPPDYGGINNDFIYAPRLDNLAMCHAGIEALTSAEPKGTSIPVVVCFDHEEVGSESATGAQSNFLYSLLERIALNLNKNREEFLKALSRSFIISADMAHALHPNYPSAHDDNLKPLLNKGPVIKSNSKQRYASDSLSSARFKELCHSAGIPFQEFINRADLSCGSTLGPIVASLTGISAVDVGNPMLSMHSAREMAGSEDHPMMIEVFKKFFEGG